MVEKYESVSYEHGKMPDTIDYKWIINRHINETRWNLTYNPNIEQLKRAVKILDILLTPKKDKRYVEEMTKLDKKQEKKYKKLYPRDKRLKQNEIDFDRLLGWFENLIKLGTRKGLIIIKEAVDEI